MAYLKVTEDNVYLCTGHPSKTEINQIIDWLINNDLYDVYESK